MTPYYSRDGVVLYHGDALEVLPQLGRDAAHVVVTDPPYGVAWQSGTRTVPFPLIAGDQDQVVGLAGLAAALRCLRGNRHVYAFGPFDLSGLPLGDVAELIWAKGQHNGGNLSLPWGPAHERIQFAVYCPSPADRRKGYGNLTARLRRGSVLSYPRLNSRAVKLGPCEKPIGLLRELIESSSRIGETVLDPFAGTGSTLEAAVREDRRAIGVEIEEHNCAIIAARLEALR